MPKSYRELVTGKPVEDPKEFSDLPRKDQAEYIATAEVAAAKLLQAAQMLRMQLTANSILKTQRSNPNLFVLAAMYYGDVRYWRTLADVSDLGNPVYSGLVEVKVPAQPSLRGVQQ